MKKTTSAKQFLNDQGINLETTALITVIDGKMRQPDLCYLMESYHLQRISDNIITNNSFTEENNENRDFFNDNLH